MRDLTAGDMMDLAGVIADVWPHIDQGLLRAASQESADGQDTGKASEAGQHVVGVLLKHGRQGLMEVMASLHDETVEQFRQRPPGDILDTVQSVVQSEAGKDFFGRLPTLLNGAGKSST